MTRRCVMATLRRRDIRVALLISTAAKVFFILGLVYGVG